MDTKKYIIEIPDNTAWLQWVKVSDKDGHVCFDFKYPEDLTPYTEPDTEKVKEDAFKNGYDAACKDIDVKSKTNAAYRKWLEVAWDAARKIIAEAPAEDVAPVNREKLMTALRNYFSIGDSYTYELSRVKSAFKMGTVSIDDFEEWGEENISDLCDYIFQELRKGNKDG